MSLDRTNSDEYCEILELNGYKIYPLTNDDFLKFDKINFEEYRGKDASLDAINQLKNSGILIDSKLLNTQKNGFNSEIQKERVDEYNRELSINKKSIIIGFIVGFLSTMILGCINPNSYLFFIGIILGIVTYIGCIYFFDKQSKRNSEEKISNDNTINKHETIYSSKIKLFQKIVVFVIVLLILFLIIYPITISELAKKKVPSIEDYKTVKLENLDSLQKIYCETKDNINYVYIKVDEEIVVYKFKNYTSNNKTGYATTNEIKNHFKENFNKGTPKVTFVYPSVVNIGIVVSSILVLINIIICYFIHKYAQEDLFNRSKRDEYLVKLKQDHANGNISDYNYKKSKRDYYSKLLKNNALLSVFKILY